MTAITDIAQARLNALYPDEHYDLKTKTHVTKASGIYTSAPNASSGAVQNQFFLFSLLPSGLSMPTLKELEKLFYEEMALGNITPPANASTEATDSVSVSETDTPIIPYFLIFLIIISIIIFLSIAYFYILSACLTFVNTLRLINIMNQ